MLMCIESPEEIQSKNNWIKAEHEQKIKEWNWKPRDSHPTKPQMKKTVCQTLACYTLIEVGQHPLMHLKNTKWGCSTLSRLTGVKACQVSVVVFFWVIPGGPSS
jgi:hypothetical protein